MSAWFAVISGDDLLDLLRRAHAGEDPDLLAAEWYANTDGLEGRSDEDA